ncbi:MAG: hypothetical protein SwBeaMacB_01670 [Shewanella algae]
MVDNLGVIALALRQHAYLLTSFDTTQDPVLSAGSTMNVDEDIVRNIARLALGQ